MTHVVFATPTMNEGVCSEYLDSFRRTLPLLAERGITCDWLKHGGDPFIDHARNALVVDFLTKYPDATDLFFIDDDVGWKASKVIEFLDRPEDVVVGSPPMKTSQVDWPIDLCVDPKGELIERDGLLQAALVPFGFVRLKRQVLTRLAARSRCFKEPVSDTATRDVYNIFDAGVFDGAVYDEDGIIDMRPSSDHCWHWGEDQVFCRKWAHLGGEIWLDPNCVFSHRGRAIWISALAKHLPFFRDKARAAFTK